MRIKKQTNANIDAMEDVFARIDSIRAKLSLDTLSVRPPGGITVTEYADRYGCDRKTAENHLKAAIKGGMMRRDRVRMPDGMGRCPAVYVYSPIGGAV